MSGNLQGLSVIVTGATKGIGREAAITLALMGAAVICTGRDEAGGAESVAAVEAAVRAKGGAGRAIYVRQDVCSEADWTTVIAAAEAMAPLGGLVNNAGVFFVKPLAETTEADFDWIYGVNVEGTFLGIKAALAAFERAGRGGSIVNVSSLMGQVGFPDATAYCATKGAITAMTKVAALEGAAMTHKVRVNSLHPGVIWTPMITEQFGDGQALADAFAADTPLRMIGLPEYVADAIAFLVGEDSAYVTGAELTVDGGRGAD